MGDRYGSPSRHVGDRSMLDLTDPRREDDLTMGGTSCYLIVGRGARGGSVALS
jgi:hypothetical protein